MMPEPYLVETVEIEDPPDELLCHRYCKKKLHWALRSLKTTVPEINGKIDQLQQLLNDQIICVHANDDDTGNFLNRLFHSSVKQQRYEHPLSNNEVKGRMIMVTVKTTTTLSDEVTLAEKSKELFESLLQFDIERQYLQNFIFLVDAHVRHDRELLEMKIRDIFGAERELNICDIGGDIRFIRDALHEKTREMIAFLLSSLESRQPTDGRVDDYDVSRDPNLIKFMETTNNLHRMLKIPSKPNVVSPELREFFHGMRSKGYRGHGFVDGRLTIYVTKEASPIDSSRLKEEAQKDFDYVTISIRQHDGVRPFSTIQPNSKVTNSVERMGTLGTFAKLQPNDKVAAISVAHFSNAGQQVRLQGRIIGKCLWPTRTPNSSHINDVSVIKIKKKFRRDCRYFHENIELQKRLILFQNQFPSQYSEVFQGCGMTGIITGTIISTQFELEYQGEFLEVCLVEGDDDVDFAKDGDSGAIIKLKKELDNKVVGVAMIFGCAHRIENVKDGTCMGISIMPSLQRFQRETSNQLLLDNIT